MPSELVFRVFVLPRPGPRVGAGAGQGRELPDHGPLRLALVTYMRSEGQLRRAGVNLNRAVAELNATGAAPVWLGRVAQRVAAAVARGRRLPATAAPTAFATSAVEATPAAAAAERRALRLLAF